MSYSNIPSLCGESCQVETCVNKKSIATPAHLVSMKEKKYTTLGNTGTHWLEKCVCLTAYISRRDTLTVPSLERLLHACLPCTGFWRAFPSLWDEHQRECHLSIKGQPERWQLLGWNERCQAVDDTPRAKCRDQKMVLSKDFSTNIGPPSLDATSQGLLFLIKRVV